MTFDYLDQEWAHQMEVGLAEYMGRLSAIAYGEDEVNEVNDGFETSSGEVYCGCATCEVREILSFVMPKTIRGYLDGKVVLNNSTP